MSDKELIGEEVRKMVELKWDGDEILVWKKSTWGSWGQHANVYTFVVDIEKKEQKPIYEVVETRYVKNDSRKNLDRRTYVHRNELRKIEGRILKVVSDSASSRNKRISVAYYKVENGELKAIEAEKGKRDEKGFYDELVIGNKKVKVRKDGVEIEEKTENFI